ncbi:hypothetical protein Zmor_017815 [Zophobas morio]|uniref:Ionotropic glutamate receptor C-terminal domain-containing protein n=1 Tax=Zophobas morio TaxID=2755281 RepID=A0AA38IA16_9CUCU|nr:hypothetical protein Zmor_017815 [Zophobas morio]
MILRLFVFNFLLLQTATSLKEFIHKHFFRETIVVINSGFNNINDKLTFILNLKQPKMLINAEHVANLEAINNFIIIEPNVTNLSSSINLIRNRTNTKGRYLIIIEDNTTEEETKSIFKTLFRFYIYNVVIYANWSVLVTWYPYNRESRCGTVVNLRTKEKTQNLFQNKIPEDLQDCYINVTWEELPVAINSPFDKKNPGYSIRLLDTVTEILNITTIYLTKNVKYMAETNGTIELKKHMIERNIQMAFFVRPIPIYFVEPECELSIHYYETYLFFILPPRRKIISSTDTLVVFSVHTWSLILVSLLAMSALWQRLSEYSLHTCLFQVIRLLLQGTTQRVPDATFSRLIFAIFFFYILNLNWIYFSQLSGILSRPRYEPKISTIHELALSDKKLLFLDMHLENFAHRSDYDLILKNRLNVEVPVLFHDKINNFARQLDHGIVETNVRMLVIKNYKQLNVVSKEQVATLRSYLMVKKGFPLLNKINDVLLRVVESGFMVKWLCDSKVDFNISKTLIPDCQYTEGHLDLYRVFGAFVLLGVGFLLSLFVVVVELICKKLNDRNTVLKTKCH